VNIDAISWERAELPVLDERQKAEWDRDLGRRVVEHQGRFWGRVARGFFEPVHIMARLRKDEATRPAWSCISFRARLTEADAASATGSIPANLMERIDQYDLARLSSRRREQVSQTMRNLNVLALRAPALVLEQGYAIIEQTHARNPGVPLPDMAALRRYLTSIFVPPRGLVLAAVRNDRLLGFAYGFAVDTAVYHDSVYVGDEGLPYNVALCLFHALATLAARRGSIRELLHGLHMPENPTLTEFKRRIGIGVVQLPARVWCAPGVGPLIHRFWPLKYYHWRGTSVAAAACDRPWRLCG
jgi:hypothetical protein